MKSQPLPSYESNDDVMTPDAMAARLIEHIDPWGTILEPCAGDGAFVRALIEYGKRMKTITEIATCEIKEGRNFYDYTGPRVDWIITNPPWSLLSARTKPCSFLEQAFKYGRNVVFLCTLNHLLGLKARYNLLDQYHFKVKEFILLDTPPAPWPQQGFQLGAVHYQELRAGTTIKRYRAPVLFSDLRTYVEDVNNSGGSLDE